MRLTHAPRKIGELDVYSILCTEISESVSYGVHVVLDQPSRLIATVSSYPGQNSGSGMRPVDTSATRAELGASVDRQPR